MPGHIFNHNSKDMKTRKLIQRTGRNAIADRSATTECSAAADRNTATACNATATACNRAAAVAAAARNATALLMAATLLLLPSCTDELSASKDSNDGNATAETRTMTITATMADDGDNNGNGTTGSNTGNGNDGQAQTRVSHETDPDGGDTPGVIVKWTKGDAFKLFYKTTNSDTTEKTTEFEIKTAEAITEGGKKANFTGSPDANATGGANALYPATAALTKEGTTATKWGEIVVKMEGQKQNGNDNYDHLPAYDYMTANVDNVTSLPTGNDLAFHHLAAMMTIKIIGAPTGYTATDGSTGTTDNSPELLTLTAGKDGSGTYGTFYRNIKVNGGHINSGNRSSSAASSINLKLEGITWGTEGFTAHLMMLPTDLSGKTFTVSVRCKDGTTYQYTTQQIGKAYVAGMRYTATIPGGDDWTKAPDGSNVKEVFNSTTTATKFAGDGSEGKPYIISTAGELKYLVEQINSYKQYGFNKYFRLTTDIRVEDNTDWTPIGVETKDINFDYGFWGHFDGGGHTIYGTLKDSRTEDKKGYIGGYFGFFGRIESGSVRNLNIKATVTNNYAGSSEVHTGGLAGVISNAEISGCNIDVVIQGGTTTGTSSSQSYTGGLIGAAKENSDIRSTISNCTVRGTVTAGKMTKDVGHINYTGGVAGYINGSISNPITIKNCDNHADITGSSGGRTSNDSDTGGIAGYTSYTNISHCTNHGKVSVQYTESGGSCYVGGLIGNMDTDTNLSDSKNQGAVTGGQVRDAAYASRCGGLAGQTLSSTTATNCTNSGTVSGNTKNTNITNYIGGLVGQNGGTLHLCHNTTEATVTKGFATATGNNFVGGLVGQNNNGTVYDCCTNKANVDGEDAADSNRIGGGNENYPGSEDVTHCEEGHTPPATTTDNHISSDGNENYTEEIL